MTFFCSGPTPVHLSLLKNSLLAKINRQGLQCCLFKVFLYSEVQKYHTIEWYLFLDQNLQNYIDLFLTLHPECTDSAFCHCECNSTTEGEPTMCTVLGVMIQHSAE